ncbi:Receptor-like protein 12 [Nymphaea thermarum]|nr:Receptor-like protein 12 [Nymphaea thermarum]
MEPTKVSCILQLKWNLLEEFVKQHSTGYAPSRSIRNSSLYGTVPTCLFSLSSLQKVDLSENSLSGTISMYLSSLSSLQELDLSKNSLNGIDPTCLFSASSLEWLDLSYNCLSGSIPSSLFTFPSLRSLNLGYNRLNELLPELYNPISNLEELYLNDNLLSGDVPSFMKNLPSLQLVFLSSNDFTGMINVSLFLSLKGLVHLDVSSNKRLKAEFSHPNNHTHDTFMNLSPLHFLNFSSCNIQSFPRFICRFQRLQQLDLSYNNIEGKIPSCLWSISDLQNLVLDQNKLDGFQKPANITGSIDSRSGFSLTASSNQIKGPIPAFLCNFTGLGFAYLDMSNNSLTGAIPNCIYKMKGVKLRWNHLQGQLPSEIFENLELLDLNGNFLTGKIRNLDDTFPAWLGQLDQLDVLVLRSNHLHGPIWASSFPQAFPALKILDISDNQFSGTLPHELFQGLKAIMSKNSEAEDSLIIGDSGIGESVGSWDMEETIKGKVHLIKEIRWAMNFIDLSNNMFIGKIPKELGMLKNLRGLNVSNNHLDGPIPKSLGNLLQMEQLDLSQNHLSGVIPVELVSLTFLSVLNLSYNDLEGIIPEGNQFNTFDSSSFEGNPKLCGKQVHRTCFDGEGQNADIVDEGNQGEDGWKYGSVGIGFGVGLMTMTLSLLFANNAADWYWDRTDGMVDFILLQIYAFVNSGGHRK